MSQEPFIPSDGQEIQVADLKKYPDAVWDRFFDFAFAECASAPRAEIQQTLKKFGIDLTNAMSKVQQAIQTARAREELASAGEAMMSLSEEIETRTLVEMKNGWFITSEQPVFGTRELAEAFLREKGYVQNQHFLLMWERKKPCSKKQ